MKLPDWIALLTLVNEINERHGNVDADPVSGADHDVIYLNLGPEMPNAEDELALDKLGAHCSEAHDCWIKFV